MLKTILVEDDFNNLELLETLLIPHQAHVQIIGKARSLKTAVPLIKELEPDLVFLDIHLSDGDGFEVLRRTMDQQYAIIFTTAYSQYSLQAFDFEATHYLLKPIHEKALAAAVQRCLKNHQHNAPTLPTKLLEQLLEKTPNPLKKLTVSSHTDLFFVDIDQILYLEADRSYTKFYLLDQTNLISSKSIGAYEKELAQASFSRIHDKYLVNLAHVVRYIKGRGGEVVLVNRKQLLVSARRKAQFIREQGAFLG